MDIFNYEENFILRPFHHGSLINELFRRAKTKVARLLWQLSVRFLSHDTREPVGASNSWHAPARRGCDREIIHHVDQFLFVTHRVQRTMV